jgi:hypothetical protein
MSQTASESLRKRERPLRFGVMCNGTIFPAWQAQCIKGLLDLGWVEPALLIVNDQASRKRPRRRRLWNGIRRRELLWTVYGRWLARWSRATRPVDLLEELNQVPMIGCRVQRKGRFSEYFSEVDLQRIREYDLDFILRFSFGIIRGDVLEAARYGVWSFHHDDEEEYRGGPPCFWEVYTDNPVTGSMLQRLTDRLDGGVVLHKGFFGTIRHSYVRNRDAAYFGSADWPTRVCKDIRSGRAAYIRNAPTTSKAPIRRNPTDGQMLVFLLRLTRNFVIAQIRGLFRTDQWNVGIISRPIESLLEDGPLPPVRWLPTPPRGRYLADPFGRAEGDGLSLLVEDYDYQTGVGRISAVEHRGDGRFDRPRPVMDLAVHGSYPYLLDWEGDLYCIPETHDAREICLYRAVRFPEEWEKVTSLVTGFAALDPTVFTYDGRWWLFCVDDDQGVNTKLHAWHASDLFGPWTPHASNPLKTDVRSSRPGGTPFVHKERLYRPAQDDSRTYGGAIVINRVERLSSTEFEEWPFRRIDPAPGSPFGQGLHTISAAGSVTLIDGKRSQFVWHAFRRELTARVRRVPILPLRRMPAAANVIE